jgi:hypothetical protein
MGGAMVKFGEGVLLKWRRWASRLAASILGVVSHDFAFLVWEGIGTKNGREY